MIKIKTDCNKAKNLVAQLVELVTSQGGFVHPRLQVVIKNGEISLSHSQQLEAAEPVIVLPLHLMPVLSDFEYTLDERRLLKATLTNAEVNSEQVEAMSLGVELYNLFGKIESYSQHCPSIQLEAHAELLHMLLDGGNAQAFAAEHFKTNDDLKIFCFWHMRGYYDIPSGTDRMLPFLEFVDHHAFADGFRTGYSQESGRTLELRFASKVKGKVLACYAAIDALECYVKYGFFDSTAFFIKSQPFSVEFPCVGEIQVEARGPTVFQLPQEEWTCLPKYSNSLFYTPRVYCEEGVPAIVSYSLIPPKRHLPAFDEALQQQMIQLERGLSLNEGRLNNAEPIKVFKSALLTHNKYFLRQLVMLAQTANLPPKSPTTVALFATLRHQAKLLRDFEKYVF